MEVNLVLSKFMQSSFARFLMSGGFNTAFTYVLYLCLLLVAPYQVSYTVAYVLGIFLAFALNRFFVFKSHRGVQSVILFPLVYIVQYLVSMIALWIWVAQLGQNEKVAPLVAIIVTVPITYLLSQFVFLKEANPKP
jgi:putative flippase GtrA